MGKKREVPDSFDFAHDVSSLEAGNASCNTDEEIWKLYLKTFQLIKMNLSELRLKTFAVM